MSAFALDEDHINYLVAAARKFGTVVRTVVGTGKGGVIDSTMDPDAFGQALWDENYRSVNHRYNTSLNVPKFKYDTRFDRFKFSTFEELAFLHQAVRCYAYQSAECPDWELTASFRFCAATCDDICRRFINDIDQTNLAQEQFPWCIHNFDEVENAMRKMKVKVA